MKLLRWLLDELMASMTNSLHSLLLVSVCVVVASYSQSAPVPHAVKLPLDDKTIREFQRLGAMYGHFDHEERRLFFKGADSIPADTVPAFWFNTMPAKLPQWGPHIGLSFNSASDVDLQVIEGKDNITILDISLTNCNNKSISSIVQCKNLATLDVGNTLIDHCELKQLAKLKNLHTLHMTPQTMKYGEARGAIITDDVVKVLSDNKILHMLSCFEGKNGERARKTAEITCVLIGLTPITDTSVEIIAKCPQLEFVDLGFTNISDKSLVSLMSCKKLSSLNISGTNITKAGLAQFKKSNPDCQVFGP